MKNFLSAWSVLILGLSITTFLFLAGCGGLNATSPAPTPNPFQPSPTPTSPHGTFVYVNSSANGISKTTGYRLNPDGTLTALAGSPFPISVMAVAGSFLAVTDSNGLSTYLIDAATGALTKAGSATVLRPGAVAADANNVYVSGDLQPEGSGTGIYGFSLAPDGALTPLAGSPTFFDGGCFFCDEPAVLAVNNT